MSRVPLPALVVLAGLTILASCGEADCVVVQECEPGEVECLADNRTRTCNEFGRWGGAQTFVCPFGSACAVMYGVAVCM